MSEPQAVPPDFSNFWRPEYLNAFRIMLQRRPHAKAILTGALRSVPAQRAHIDYWEDIEGDDRLIVLLTHDHDNEGARANEAWLMMILVETRALMFFGTEGAVGAFDFSPYRAFPDRSVNVAIARHFMSDFSIGPLEFVAVVCREPIFAWGIEDRDLYLAALEAYRKNGAAYYSLIERRPELILQNLLDIMEKQGARIAGACLTDYNYQRIHSLLRDRRIPHIGVRMRSVGPNRGRLDKKLRGQKDQDETFVHDLMLGKLEGFRGWLRSLRRPRFAGPFRMEIHGEPQSVAIMKEYKIERAFSRGEGTNPALLRRVPSGAARAQRHGGTVEHPAGRKDVRRMWSSLQRAAPSSRVPACSPVEDDTRPRRIVHEVRPDLVPETCRGDRRAK